MQHQSSKPMIYFIIQRHFHATQQDISYTWDWNSIINYDNFFNVDKIQRFRIEQYLNGGGDGIADDTRVGLPCPQPNRRHLDPGV
jgi:hypothetical protein